jgi:hypothetical protein
MGFGYNLRQYSYYLSVPVATMNCMSVSIPLYLDICIKFNVTRQDLIRISASQVLSSRMFVVAHAKDNKEASNHIPFSTTSTKGVQSFLLVGYYTIFFFKPFLAAPLNDMILHKDFNWSFLGNWLSRTHATIYNCMGLRAHDPSLPKLGGRPDAAEKIGVGALLIQVRPPITWCVYSNLLCVLYLSSAILPRNGQP